VNHRQLMKSTLPDAPASNRGARDMSGDATMGT
jgi:hypothetical protein